MWNEFCLLCWCEAQRLSTLSVDEVRRLVGGQFDARHGVCLDDDRWQRHEQHLQTDDWRQPLHTHVALPVVNLCFHRHDVTTPTVTENAPLCVVQMSYRSVLPQCQWRRFGIFVVALYCHRQYCYCPRGSHGLYCFRRSFFSLCAR